MPRLARGALALSAAALVMALAASPAGASTAPGDTRRADGLEKGEFGTTLPGRQALLVTFEDAPGMTEARRRLAGLGAVRDLAGEAGVVVLAPRRPVSARTVALRRDGVLAAEWSLARTTDATASKASQELLPVPRPTDVLFGSQWSLRPGRLWSPELTGSATRPPIAILDGGVDTTHEEWGGPDSPLIHPYSSWRRAGSAPDWGRTGHGTHVAGIAAAPANGVGVVGVAPARAGAPVIPVQIADRDGRSTDETMIGGIRWAVRSGARVINISAGGPGFSQAFQRTVNWAYRRGVLIVSSVGNDGERTLNYPAAYQHVLGVGAQCDGEVASPDCLRPFGVAGFTNANSSLDVVAPGVGILSSIPLRVTENRVEPGYGLKDGTSMAAPYVAGVAALVFGAHPEASPYQVMRQIQNTATDLGKRGRDNASGYGAVNPEAAVTLPLPDNDPGESNDDVSEVRSQAASRSSVEPIVIRARADRRDDAQDVYPVLLRRGQRVRVTLTYTSGALNLYLWRPGTKTVMTTVKGNVRRNLVAFGGRRAARRQVFTATAPTGGRHFVNVFARAGGSQYTLTITPLPAGS